MRTRLQVLATNPPPFDILVWVPSMQRFERHAALDDLPDGIYPTEAADLALILPHKTLDELARLTRSLGGTPLRPANVEAAYQRLWWALRHMPVTGTRSTPGFIPLNFTVVPPPRPRRKRGRPLHKRRSGESRPDSKTGTQLFYLTYTPGAIESRDLAFADLSPIAHEIMCAIFSIGKKKFTRPELVAALENHKSADWAGLQSQARLGRRTPWDAFTRYRSLLERREFIRAEPKYFGSEE